jgi:short-subunit dehydrogenase involved in D-alanine esterification of teichoic acids
VRQGSVVIVGGTSGIGLRLAETYAARGRHVVITGRNVERTAGVAGGVSGLVRTLAVELGRCG